SPELERSGSHATAMRLRPCHGPDPFEGLANPRSKRLPDAHAKALGFVMGIGMNSPRQNDPDIGDLGSGPQRTDLDIGSVTVRTATKRSRHRSCYGPDRNKPISTSDPLRSRPPQTDPNIGTGRSLLPSPPFSNTRRRFRRHSRA